MVRYQAHDVYGQMLARSEQDTAMLARWVKAYREARQQNLPPERACRVADQVVAERLSYRADRGA